MAKKTLRITAAQYEQAHDKIMGVLSKELPKRGLKKMFGRLKSDGPFARRFTKKWLGKYMAAKGITDFAEINWNDLIKYIIENLPAIIEALMALFTMILVAFVLSLYSMGIV